jgi:hypothetical protein
MFLQRHFARKAAVEIEIIRAGERAPLSRSEAGPAGITLPGDQLLFAALPAGALELLLAVLPVPAEVFRRFCRFFLRAFCLARRRLLLAALLPFEQRIALQFRIDKRLELEIRHLQELDRLLQLRRHHQPL